MVLARERNAGRMDLGKTGIGEKGAPLMGPPDCGGIGHLGIGREEENIRISPGRQDDRIADD